MDSNKRKDYLTWEEYFMALAEVSAKRSKDPVTQVGACIVNDKHRVISLGYNGFPIGCSDDEFPWGKDETDPTNSKYQYVVHAELNAILNCDRDLEGCTIYVTSSPCNECAKAIIQSGIKKVVYKDEYKPGSYITICSKRMLEAAGIEYVAWNPKQID